ncbi:hypothetical protein AGMMS49574_25520 [Bacteroidia bacterium]|nr:hypothetical protein AGMMS49574_25520 [Bacteroidia bacterium]GHU54932.1 hypothetical protein FACS189411_02450 [Bacteroidia bacterium]
MSYSKNFRETIVVNGAKTVSVSYPASQYGGITSATINYTENVPVEVTVQLDTQSFDTSISNCNQNIDQLTGNVLTAKSAQIESVTKSSIKIASSIVDGFFGYIHSDMSMQITELSQRIQATLMHLKELAKSCVSKKSLMENDYNRISNRYQRIFNDLNHELYNRISDLDRPAFLFKKEMDNHHLRTGNSDLVNTALSGGENGNIQAAISVSAIKNSALNTLYKTKSFLLKQKLSKNTIQESMLNESLSGVKYVPVCFIETENEAFHTNEQLYTPDYISLLQDNSLKDNLIGQFSRFSDWNFTPKEYKDQLNLYFKLELNKSISSAEPHSVRVKEMIQRIANLDSIVTLNV